MHKSPTCGSGLHACNPNGFLCVRAARAIDWKMSDNSSERKDSSNRNDDGKRRSSRRSISPLPPRRLADDNGDTPAAKRSRTSIRKFAAEIKCCTDLKEMNNSFKCAGCARWDESKKLKPREEIKTREHQCLQAWKLKTVPQRLQKHYNNITGCIETAHDIHRSVLIEEPVATAATPKPPLPPPTTTMATVTPTEMRMLENKFQSCGKTHTCWLPHTHKIAHRDHNKRIENDSELLATVVHKLQSSCFSTNSVFSQTLFSLAMSSAPALALSAAQHLIPLCFMAFICDTQLFRRINIKEFVTSFPSDWLLRKCIHQQATRDTISMGLKLRGKRMHLSCDKGNKRGVSHFIKLLSSWDPTNKRVDVQVLDIDGSGGATADCAKATQASINKLKVNDADQTHLLAGQSTDSGGGGVLESLAEEMQALGLFWLDNCLVANCCTHGTQLQLSNGIKAALGEGGLENINVMQMLHSVYRLQEAIDLEEWRHILCVSSQAILEFEPSTVPDTIPIVGEEEEQSTGNNNKAKKKKKKSREETSASNKAVFMVDLKKTHGFHSSFKINNESDPSTLTKCKETIYRTMIAPILTRWWTVGSGASHVFDCCLQLFCACQTVINMYPSGSTPNDIASDLFAMMKDQNNFIDMCLIRTFNKNYLNTHLDWFQDSKDLTNANGFQSHQVATRYHLMDFDLRNMLNGERSRDYIIAMDRGNPNDKALYMKKLEVFGVAARSSLYKHFDRWIKSPLLPAGLMAEAPAANVVAAAMLKKDPTHGTPEDRNTGKMTYSSPTHKRAIDLKRFCLFLRQRLEIVDVDNHDCTAEAKVAAQLALDGVDMRSFECDGDHGNVRLDMHSTYLPLACQTQFVESVVKEAKHVSQTDRSEQQRSCCAIVRSATPLSKADKNANAEKIKAIINSALDRSAEHVRLMRDQVNNECDSWFATTAHSLARMGHFEMDRVDAKTTRVADQGLSFKKQNVAQQTKPQQLMPAITGLMPFGKLVKARNHDDLKVELLFREMPEADVPESITDRKAKLKQHEFNRLVSVGMEGKAAAEQAKKCFMKLSDAPFKLNDD